MEKKKYRLLDSSDNTYESDIPGILGGHRKLKIYGKLDCHSALSYIAKGQYVEHRLFFINEQAVIAAGYRPCAR